MALDDLTREELEALAQEREIVIEEGSGAGGGVVKADLVAALRAAGVEPTEPAGEADRTPTRCRVRRKWSQRTATGAMTYAPGSLALVPRYRAEYFSDTDPPHLEILD